MTSLFVIRNDMAFNDKELSALTNCGDLSSVLQEIQDPEEFKSMLRKCNRLLPRRAVRMDHWRVQRDLRIILLGFVPNMQKGSFLKINDDLLVILDSKDRIDIFRSERTSFDGRAWRNSLPLVGQSAADMLPARSTILKAIRESARSLRAHLKANPALLEALEKKKQAQQTVGLIDALAPITALRDALNTVEGAIRKGTITDQTIADLSKQIKFLNSKKGLIRKALIKMKTK